MDGAVGCANGQRSCSACGDKIPAVPGGPITDEEVERVVEMVRGRLLAGREKYRGSFTQVDLKADVLEEIADVLNYAGLMLVRLSRQLPAFEGPTSNDWYEANG